MKIEGKKIRKEENESKLRNQEKINSHDTQIDEIQKSQAKMRIFVVELEENVIENEKLATKDIKEIEKN